jgi:hypothetical protein
MIPRGPRPFRRRYAVLCAVALAATGCGRAHDDKNPGPAPLTGQQAESLALTRFADYRAGTAHTTASIPLPGQRLLLDARLDWRAHTGYGLLRDASVGTTRHWQHLLRWDRTTVSVHYDWRGPAPARPPKDGWAQRDLQPGTSTVDTALTLLLDLAADRPDNAQLLARSGAHRVGAASIDGDAVTEFSGPSVPATSPSSSAASATGTDSGPGTSRTRYWIDSRNTLRRFAARLPASPGWMTAQLTPK